MQRFDMVYGCSQGRRQGEIALIIASQLSFTRSNLGKMLLMLPSLGDLLSAEVSRIFSFLISRLQKRKICNGRAGILRAITILEVHLSPSFSLFNLKALSVVVKVALGEKFLAISDIGDRYGR
ncbi:MAG: hypothetical protein WBA22_10350 [Candidatus Methanofastidiosia archaeon]